MKKHAFLSRAMLFLMAGLFIFITGTDCRAQTEDPLYLAIVWHQHQPHYFQDPDTGEYMEPWVRLHCSKDYYDMISVLEDYPELHQTVNLTPTLLRQITDLIERYDAGKSPDRWLRLTLKPADKLTEDEKRFILESFFSVPPETMIKPYYFYNELYKKRGAGTDAALKRYTAGDYRDLQVWFNLVWIDPIFRTGEVQMPDGKIVTVRDIWLKKKDYTEEDKKALVQAQFDIMRNVIGIHKEYQDKGRIEVVTSPYAHPILPLVYDSDLYKKAMPGSAGPSERYSYPQDAKDHLTKAADLYRELFKREPRGLWPGEGSVAQEIVPLVSEAGFTWMATSEGILAKSLKSASLRPDEKYRPYRLQGSRKPLSIVFRDIAISDRVGFNYSGMAPQAAAADFMRSIHAIKDSLKHEKGPHLVTVILDGENAWQNYENDGVAFFKALYTRLAADKSIKSVTVSEYLEMAPPTITIRDLWAGAWFNDNFSTWIGEPEENQAWDYLARTRADLEKWIKRRPSATVKYKRAMEHIYVAEGSDWFWWFGKDQYIFNEGTFDEMFRNTLKEVYRTVNLPTPDFLSVPIIPRVAAPPVQAPTGIAKITLDGNTGPDEWSKGGYYDDPDGAGGVMIRAGDTIRRIRYAYDKKNIYFYLETDFAAADKLDSGYEARIYLYNDQDNPLVKYKDDIGGKPYEFGFPVFWKMNIPLSTQTPYLRHVLETSSFNTELPGAVKFGDGIEISIPIQEIKANVFQSISVCAVLISGDNEFDIAPNTGPITIELPGAEILSRKLITDDRGDIGNGNRQYDLGRVWGSMTKEVLAIEYELDHSGQTGVQVGIALNTKPGGGRTDPWARKIDYKFADAPDYIVYINFDSDWRELRRWIGDSWVADFSGAGVLDYTIDGPKHRLMLPLSRIGTPYQVGVEVWVTMEGDYGAYDAAFSDKGQESGLEDIDRALKGNSPLTEMYIMQIE